MENKKSMKRRCHSGQTSEQPVAPKGPSRPVTVQCSVKKRHLLAAIKAVKNKEPEDELSWERNPHYQLHEHYLQKGRCVPVRHLQKENLLLVLKNALNHHDWSTAALALKFMCESNYHINQIIGPVFQVLLNHPDSNDESLLQLLSELSLRTKEEQRNFLAHLLHLPQDMEGYNDENNFELDFEYDSDE